MPSTSLKILVVEDMVVVQAIMAYMFRTLGYSPDFAVHGGEALEAAMASSYDIIFTDLQMPVLDGVMAARAIREWEKDHSSSRKPAKIIAVTSNVSEDDRRRCAEAGMDGFISKPISLERLRAALEQFSS